MSNSYWGYWLILLGIFVIVIMLLVSNVTTTNTQDYYLIKEVTEASLVDAVDLGYYRQSRELRINKEVFVENFLRRFSENVALSQYQIDFYGLYEAPPKVSVKVTTKSGTYNIAASESSFDITNKIDAILEVDGAALTSEKQDNNANRDAYRAIAMAASARSTGGTGSDGADGSASGAGWGSGSGSGSSGWGSGSSGWGSGSSGWGSGSSGWGSGSGFNFDSSKYFNTDFSNMFQFGTDLDFDSDYDMDDGESDGSEDPPSAEEIYNWVVSLISYKSSGAKDYDALELAGICIPNQFDRYEPCYHDQILEAINDWYVEENWGRSLNGFEYANLEDAFETLYGNHFFEDVCS